MTMPDDDDADLRQAFADLRRADAEAAPPFERLRAHAVRPGRRLAPGRALLVAASLAAAVIAGLAVRRPHPAPPPPVSIEEWAAPTDFLLETPGLEIVQTVPSIGTEGRSLLP